MTGEGSPDTPSVALLRLLQPLLTIIFRFLLPLEQKNANFVSIITQVHTRIGK